MEMKVNNQPVARVRRVTWHPNDARELRGVDRVQIIGRCHVELEDGTPVVAPLCARTDMEHLGDTFALVFNVNTGCFAAIPVEVKR
jgi:hypothetical protein